MISDTDELLTDKIWQRAIEIEDAAREKGICLLQDGSLDFNYIATELDLAPYDGIELAAYATAALGFGNVVEIDSQTYFAMHGIAVMISAKTEDRALAFLKEKGWLTEDQLDEFVGHMDGFLETVW